MTNQGHEGGVDDTASPGSLSSIGASIALRPEDSAEQLASLAEQIREAMPNNETATDLLAKYERLVQTRISSLEDKVERLRPTPDRWEYKRRVDPISLVPYPKRLLKFREQAELLLRRGMIGDVDAMEKKLSFTNYYRLSGYFYFFREHQGANRHLGENYRAGTTFDEVWEIYVFDSRLRELVNAAIEKIEVAVRTQISYHHGCEFNDIFAYATRRDAITLGTKEQEDGSSVEGRDTFLMDLQRLLTRSKEQFIEHFYNTYSDRYPPIFIAAEILTLGAVKHIYDGSPIEVRRAVANHFRLAPRQLGSWLLTLNTARNVCAHHGRFWNRSLGNRPSVPPRQTHSDFHTPVEIIAQPHRGEDGRTIQPPTTFAILSLCNYLLTQIDEHSKWGAAVRRLLEEFPGVKRLSMGFPPNWNESPVWKNAFEHSRPIPSQTDDVTQP